MNGEFFISLYNHSMMIDSTFIQKRGMMKSASLLEKNEE